MKPIAIVLLNFNGIELLKKFLNDLITNSPEADIILVDNNSNDSKIDNYKSKYNRVKWIENPKNYGFSRACNIGASNATAERRTISFAQGVLSKKFHSTFSAKIVWPYFGARSVDIRLPQTTYGK